MKRNASIRRLVLISLLSVSFSADAKDHGIFVDGGYGPGETDMNDLVDRRVDGAKMVFDERHPNGESTRAASKAELEAQIKAITCGAGDSITLVMVGHGKVHAKSTEELFYFALSPEGPEQHVSADELKQWLAAATIGCECEIHVVIFSCYSGAFIDDLFMDQHVKSVFTSSQSDQRTYTDAYTDSNGFQDRGDWMSGFIDGWRGVPPGTPLGAALEEAAESGWSSTPLSRGQAPTKPAGWRRGEIAVKAHVERQESNRPKSLKVRFWSPSWLRCYECLIPVDRAVAFPKRFQECEWIGFDATFGLPANNGMPNSQNSRMTGNPMLCPAPTETVLAHVEDKANSRGEIPIHTFGPNWQACKQRTLRTGEGVSVDDEVRACSWIEQPVTVTDPDGDLTTSARVVPTSPKVPVIAHVENPQAGRNTIGVKIRQPAFLAGLLGDIRIRLDGRQAELLPQLARCDLIRVNLCLRQVGDRTYTVSEIAEIDQKSAFSFGHDAGLDRITGPARIHSFGEPVTPRCILRNAGEQPLELVRVVGRILFSGTTVYSNAQVIPFLEADSQIEVAFPAWSGEEVGRYRVEFEAIAPGDENVVNDKLAMSFALDVLNPGGEAWESTHLDTGQPVPFTAVENDLLVTGFGTGFRTNFSDSAAWLYHATGQDFELTAFLGAQENGVHAGFMAREANDVGAPFVALVVEPGVGAKVLIRSQIGEDVAETGSVPEATYPLWIRLRRESTLLTGQYSLDAETWLNVGFAEFQASQEALLAGPACYSGGANQLTAVFQEVSGFPTVSAIIQRPANVHAVGFGTNGIHVTWEDRSLTETGFAIDRAEGEGSFMPLVMLAPNAQSYSDTDLAPATLYTYRVRALKQLPNQDWSAVASAVTFGNGLEAWSVAHGVGDPYIAPTNGQAPIVAYFSGAIPAEGMPCGVSLISQEKEIFVLLAKGAGIYDAQAEVQELDDAWGKWFTLYTLGRDLPSGTHKFLLPKEDDGIGILRVRFLPAR